MLFECKVSKALVLENKTAEDVSQAMIESGRQKEPFYIFEMDLAYERIEHFKEVMPRIKIFYAMKANHSDMMLKLAASCGLGFDCASPGEIHKILKINVSPLLLIRIRVVGTSIYNLGKKFGCDFETEAVDLLEEAAALNIMDKVAGVTYHVGSACSSPESYVFGLQQAKFLFEHEAKAGRKMNIVDIGGGFMSDRTDRIDEDLRCCELQITTINNLQQLFLDLNIQIIAEPGRYLCDSSYTLYCNINNVRAPIGDTIVNMLYINDGVHGTLRYNEPWHTVKRYEGKVESQNKYLEPAILLRPSCDSTDRVVKNVEIMLPRCTPHDWLVFSFQGAYTFTITSKFSSLEGPRTRNIVSEVLCKKIKNSKAFEQDDFVKQDISEPLQSSLPPVMDQTRLLDSSYF